MVKLLMIVGRGDREKEEAAYTCFLCVCVRTCRFASVTVVIQLQHQQA